MSRRLAFPLLLLGLLVTACGDLPTSLQAEAGSLSVNRALWNRAGITSYRYTVLRACECAPETSVPVVVEVVDGAVQNRFYASSGATLQPQFAADFPTVPGLFDLIQDALDQQAAGLSVRYDAELGYPVSIQVDYVAGIQDDEVTWRISGFERLAR